MDRDHSAAIEAGGGALIDAWLEESLSESLAAGPGQSEERRALGQAAAREAVRQLAPEEAGPGARMLALQFVCSHAAGLDYQAQAWSRELPPDARATAQRLAIQLMGVSGRQLGALNRLEAERRRAADAAARRALMERQYAWRQDAGFARALADGMDRFLGSPQALAAAVTGEPMPGEALAGETPAVEAGAGAGAAASKDKGAAKGNGTAPLSRQQRRALERQEKKAARRLARAAAAAA